MLENEEGDRFIVIFKTYEKIDHENFLDHTFVFETFSKNKISQNLNDFFNSIKTGL